MINCHVKIAGIINWSCCLCQTRSYRAINLQVPLDGHNLQQLDKYRVTSPPFNAKFVLNNIFGYHAGSTQAVVDGFYILLQPLSSGKHGLHFGTLTPPASYGGSPFIIDVTYHLTVMDSHSFLNSFIMKLCPKKERC